MRSTRATWRDFHFSRRVGEQVPDARYSCAIEGPRPGRIRNWLCWVAALVVLSLPFVWSRL